MRLRESGYEGGVMKEKENEGRKEGIRNKETKKRQEKNDRCNKCTKIEKIIQN